MNLGTELKENDTWVFIGDSMGSRGSYRVTFGIGSSESCC